MQSRIITFPAPPAKPGQAAEMHTPRYALYAPVPRRTPVEDRISAMSAIIGILLRFIFNVVVFYTGWHLLALYKIISAQPTSGWTWLLAMQAIWPGVDRFINELESKDKASGATGFWMSCRRKALANGTEAAAFSTIIFLLGWLTDALQYFVLFVGAVTGGVLIGAAQTAGRLRHPIWLAAMDDIQTGAFCGAFFPALVYLFGFSSNGRSPNETVWYLGIGLCAAVGGGINLWRKSRRAVG